MDPVVITPEVIESIRKFIAPFTDPVFEELGYYVADKIKFIRFKNSIDVLIKARKILEDHGLIPSHVDPKIIVHVLEGAGLETEEDMVNRWAQLLASASTGGDVTPAFPAILTQLTGIEANILDWLWNELIERKNVKGAYPIPYVAISEASEKFKLNRNDLFMAIDNLIRLRLIQTGGYFDTSQHESIIMGMTLSVTVLGNAFVRACSGINKSLIDI
jgi:hypothetical protein